MIESIGITTGLEKRFLSNVKMTFSKEMSFESFSVGGMLGIKFLQALLYVL